MKIKEITNERFDSKLKELIAATPAGNLLMIPGIYEVLAEWFNNDILDALTALTEDEGGA